MLRLFSEGLATFFFRSFARSLSEELDELESEELDELELLDELESEELDELELLEDEPLLLLLEELLLSLEEEEELLESPPPEGWVLFVMIIFGAFFKCSRKSSVMPPNPMDVKKLIANRVFRGLSLGKMPLKISAI